MRALLVQKCGPKCLQNLALQFNPVLLCEAASHQRDLLLQANNWQQMTEVCWANDHADVLD